jgi:cytochrome P450
MVVHPLTAPRSLAPELLLDPAVIDEPYAFYRLLIEDAPVWRVPGTDIILVSSFAAVSEAVGRTGEFSSNLVALLYRKVDGTPATYPFDTGMHTLATADPPTHSVHRKSVFPQLVARRMAALRGEIEQLAWLHVDRALRRTTIEAMDEIANAIPIRVVSKLIGFQDEDPDALLSAAFSSTGMLGATELLDALLARMARTTDVVGWITDQLQAVLDGKQADGILAVVASAVRNGELEFGEGIVITATLLSAGGESTTGLLGNALHTLATDLDLQSRVRADHDLVNPFIEEALRLESPFRHHLRHATVTTELGGVAIPAGATMLLLWGAANRDPAEFERPEEVVLDRPAPRHHLGFGRGIHLCVGAPLARLEAEVVLTRILQGTKQFTLDPDHPPRRVNSLMVRRFKSLPLLAVPA